MPPVKTHNCTSCGKSHRRHADLCWYCDRAINPRTTGRNCVICGTEIPREKGRGSSCYCSSICASAVSDARVSVAQAIAKQIKTLVLQPAKKYSCVDCGKPATDYDHRRYLQPLDVVPVCRSCNLKRGPANDVLQFVAKHLGVDISEVPKAMIQKLKEREERWANNFNRRAA